MPTSKTRRRRQAHTAPVPNLHFWTLIIVGVLIVMSMFMYLFSPETKAKEFSGITLFLLGLLGGKLSNNFGKSLSVAPTTEVDVVEVADEEDGADEAEGNSAP